MTRRAAAAVLAVLAVLAVVTACADGGDRGSAGAARRPTAPTTTAPPATTTAVLASTTTVPAAPREPRDAADAAALVRQTETAIATGAADLASAAKQQQLAYRVIAAHPEWDAAVRAALPPALRPVLDANVTAGRELRVLTKPRPSLPPWHIVAPAPADELLADYRAAEQQFGVPWSYLAAIHLVETRMGRIRGPSTAGARGPMQFLPSTWATYGAGGDIESNHDAIFTAARYLKANGAPGDLHNALWHYNHSEHYVRAVTLYAERMAADEHAYRAYWHWDVYYRLTTGDVLLPVGWSSPG